MLELVHIVMVMPLLISLEAETEKRWRIEAEAGDVLRHEKVRIVRDADASSGRALQISSEIEGDKIILLRFSESLKPGKYRLAFRLKAENLFDLGKGWRIEVREGGKITCYDVVYGYDLKRKNGYQDFVLACELGGTPLEISMHWSGNEGTPTLYLDAIDLIRQGDAAPARLKSVWPDRIRYVPGQSGDITVSLASVSAQLEKVDLRLELLYDLGTCRSIGERTVELEPGRTLDLKFPLGELEEQWGYEIRATLEQDGNVLDQMSEFFTVHDNVWAVGQSGSFDVEPPDPIIYWHHTITMGGGHSDEEIAACVDIGRRQKGYCTKVEMGRMPEELLYMAPAEPMWIDNQAGWVVSKHEMRYAVTALKKHGIGVVLYLSPYAWGGPYLMKLIREKPEWFIFHAPGTSENLENIQDAHNRNIYEKRAGDFHVNYQPDAMERLARFWESLVQSGYNGYVDPDSPGWQGTEADWVRYKAYWKRMESDVAKLNIPLSKGSIMPNHKLPEVVDHVANQIIASVKMFGWDGIRWDGRMGVYTADFAWPYVPYYDFWGNPLNTTVEEAIEQTLAIFRRLKFKVAKKLPNLVWGYNYSSWSELNRDLRLTEEMCRDGGWMLNEFSQWYNRLEVPWDDIRSKKEPYNIWRNFYSVISDEGELVTKLGGHYHPYIGGWKYPPDDIYGGIVSLATRGHPVVSSGYLNSCFPTGNRNQFAVRFGRFVYDNNLRRVDQPEEIVSITSDEPIWWKKSVYRLSSKEEDHLVIHLINPPVAEEIEGDPSCSFRDPVKNVVVEVELPENSTKVDAWALSCESWTWGKKAKSQAVPLKIDISKGKASATIPQVLFWKMVVVKFE